MGCVASSLTTFLKIPFVVRDFDVHDVCWIKGNLCVATNFADKLALNNRDITNDATIAQPDVHDLVTHADLGLVQEKLAPVFWQARRHHLTFNSASRKAFGVHCSVVLGRSFRNKSSKEMPFPHPKSRKNN